MIGKYRNLAILAAAYGIRQYTRMRIRGAVKWDQPTKLEDGCTAIIGIAHHLPGVLIGNLKCLRRNSWPELRKVLAIVDSTEGALPSDIIHRAKLEFSDTPIEFVYYSKKQKELANKLCLPYVYSWLSWCIGLGIANTKHILIHDYDALILRDGLERRYAKFLDSGASIQGISWYQINGIRPSDRLATTFEAFIDLAWVRQFQPIMLFNQVALKNGRSIDYDTLLEVQDIFTPRHARTVENMSDDDLVHPSQMIHQYTMFRRSPGKPLPCFSIAMIPFFNWLSGDQSALKISTQKLRVELTTRIDLLGDGTLFNLSQLTISNIDWNLKQMIKVCEGLDIAPFKELIAYGDALYDHAGAPAEKKWVGAFSDTQMEWIRHAMAN